MNFPILERLAEVQQRLAPVLSELGLKAKITRPMKAECIGFLNDDGSLEHPVRLLFGSGVPSKTKGDWSGTRMRVSQVVEQEIGDNGWKINCYYDPEEQEVGGADADEFFDRIEAALRRYPVIRSGGRHNNLIDQMFFREGFTAVEDIIRGITTSPINVERVDGVASMSFAEEYSGDIWRITFPGNDAVLTINDKHQGTVSALNRNALKMMVFKKIEEQHIPRLDLGY